MISMQEQTHQYVLPAVEEREQEYPRQNLDIRLNITPTHSIRRIADGGTESRPFSRTTIGASSIRTSHFNLNLFDSYKIDDLTNYAMNDQRWTLQRKKIGLARKTSGSRERRVRNKQIKEMNLRFIIENFKRKECFKYKKDDRRSQLFEREVCFCGISRYDHEVFKPEEPNLYRPLTNMDDAIGNQRFALKLPSFNGKIGTKKGKLQPLKPITEGKVLISEENNENNPLQQILQANGITTRKSRDKPKKPGISDHENLVKEIPKEFDSKGKWSKDAAMKEFPTNAYGKIEFINETSGSKKPAKYIRVADNTDISSVLALMTDYWQLMDPERPNLVISVIGGAKNFLLDGKKKETFNSSLIKAVKSTQAWLLTGGMHVGVTKIIGEAVNEGQYIVKVKRKSFFAEERDHMVRGIKCVGIAPWGYIKNGETLINPDPLDFPIVKYKVEEGVQKHANISLNGDHTHFLLIDDGIRNRYSGADRFRTELQRVIQQPEPEGLDVPVVLLVLNGGITAVTECSMALQNSIPVVVVHSTGRAADLIAYAVSMTIQTPSGEYILRKGHRQQILNQAYAFMPELEGDQYEFCCDTVIKCCSKLELITVYDINSNEEMDKYILYALLKGKQNSEQSMIDKLNLALLWNRPDIAESHIFPSFPAFPSGALEELMTTALLQEKTEFVRLFVVNGMVMEDYLTVQRLRKLYNDVCTYDSHIGRLLERCAKHRNFYLCHVHLVLQALMKKHHDPIYEFDTPEAFHNDASVNYSTFRDPYQELLLWSIFSGRGTLAYFFWDRCNTPLIAAITASGLYRSLWISLGAKNTEFREQYLKQKAKFEELAVNFLEECYKTDPINSLGIVERRYAKWGEMDCLELAFAANDLHVIASPCCQAAIEINWRRGMIRSPDFAIIIGNFIPFLILTRLFSFQRLGDDGGTLTKFQKIFVFYKSPVSKFYSHSMSFLLFLVLYAYVVMFDFRPYMSLAEKILVLWIFTHITGEIFELMNEEASKFTGKLNDWWSSVWNKFDIIAYLLAITALILRQRADTFHYGRILYAINTTIFYLRVFRIYHVNYHLGPKLVIFYRMISEIIVFMALLVIFILGYGIASQALLNPWRTFESTNITTIIKNVFLTPYWQMYGELLLEEINAIDEERCALSHWGVEICENPKNYTWVVYSMLFFYLIIGNIMLLNLLIAIFTYVFDEVQENSMEIWKFEMYRLIREYDRKPGLVPPFVILEQIYRVVKLLWKKYCRKKRENLDIFMEETLRTLAIFEKEALTSFLIKCQQAKDASVESIIARMSKKIDRIAKQIEQEADLKDIEDDLAWTNTKEYQGRALPIIENRKMKFASQNKENGNKNSEEHQQTEHSIPWTRHTNGRLSSATSLTRPLSGLPTLRRIQSASTTIERQQNQLISLQQKMQKVQANQKTTESLLQNILNSLKDIRHHFGLENIHNQHEGPNAHFHSDISNAFDPDEPYGLDTLFE